MARDLTTGMVTAVTSDPIRPAYLVKIETELGPVYAWSGLGSITWNGMTFLGLGNFGGVDTVSETSDVSAQGVNFTLSGVDPTFLEMAISSIQQKNQAFLWLGAFDSNNNLIPDPFLLFQGFTDVPSITEGDDNQNTITISAENKLIDLARARERRYTTEDQKLIDPTDKGFDYVPGLQDAQIRFGN